VTPEQEQQLAQLWADREAAAEQVRKTAFERVFSVQEQALREQIERTSAQLAASQKAIDALTESVRSLGDRVIRAAKEGQESLRDEIAALRLAADKIRRDKK
jgi:hypothetical protein